MLSRPQLPPGQQGNNNNVMAEPDTHLGRSLMVPFCLVGISSAIWLYVVNKYVPNPYMVALNEHIIYFSPSLLTLTRMKYFISHKSNNIAPETIGYGIQSSLRHLAFMAFHCCSTTLTQDRYLVVKRGQVRTFDNFRTRRVPMFSRVLHPWCPIDGAAI